MTLSELNFRCVGGLVVEGRGTSTLTFDCPKCGPPNQVSILVSDRVIAPYVWKMIINHEDYERITVEPSISNHYHAKMKPCGWHGSIINGEVVSS